MECRPLEITVLSAKDLKDVNLFTKMDVYAVVSIKGDAYTKQKQKTPVDKDCGPNPNWNYTIKFTIDEASLQQNRLTLKFEIKSDRNFGDKDIGEVNVPIKELLDAKEGQNVSYAVSTPSGKSKGTLRFSFKFGDKFNLPVPEKSKKMDEPVTAYPAPGYAAGSSTAYPSPGGYPPPPPPYGEAGKGQSGYPYHQPYPYQPPPQHAFGGYAPPQPGYGYPGYPPQPGYGGYPPQMMQQPQKPKKSGAGNMALGLGAGLLGGLLVGDMISDVGEMGAYDAGFDDGFGF